MDCNTDLSPISIDFQHAGTLYPESATFEYGRNQYSTLRCSFGKKTVEGMSDHLQSFDEAQKAEVKIQGETIRPMYFEPQFLQLGTSGTSDKTNGYLELHDLREHLKKGHVDFAPERVTTKRSFEKIYKNRVKDNIFTGIEVLDEGETIGNWFNEQVNNPLIENSDKTGPIFPYSFEPNIFKAEETDFEGGYAINYDSTPLKALRKAEQKHGVSTRVSSDGKLIVGPYNNNQSYVASNMVNQGGIHIRNASLGKRSNNVSRVVLRGPIRQAQDIVGDQIEANWIERKAVALAPYEEGEADYRKTVVVDNRNVDDGVIIKETVDNLTPEDKPLKTLAKQYYAAITTSHNSGMINFSMEDTAEIIPRIKDRVDVEMFSVDCSVAPGADRLSNEYFVSSVKHDYDSHWDVQASVIDVPPQDPSSLSVSVKYYDVENDQTITTEELYGFKEGK